MSARNFRLPSGGAIDRNRPLKFTFDGKSYRGYQGDTLASALLANGVRVVGRSFKYHRPRGILSAGPEEPNALVELRSGAWREPNTRATVAELFDGLDARSQNRWPSLKYDVLAVNSVAAPLLKAGFYYKTFMWPASFWEKVYEPLIRRSAGLGRAAGAEDPDHYEKSFAFCDVLVIGGGPSGLTAALAAGRTGARVILCDEDFEFGGRLQSDKHEINGEDARDWLRRAIEELRSLRDVRLLQRTTVFGAYDHGVYGAVERVSDHLPVAPEHAPRQRLWHITAGRAVLAAGAIERPVVFGGNDRPGVMLAGAVRTYLNRFGVAPGKRAVVFANSDDAWTAARDLRLSGCDVAALVDARNEVPVALEAMAHDLGIETVVGGRILSTGGGLELRSAEIEDAEGGKRVVSCDLLAMSGGWNPSLHLTCHLGGKPVWSAERGMFLPGRIPAGMTVAGAASGELRLADALVTGTRAGREAAVDAGYSPGTAENWQTDDEAASSKPIWHIEGSKGKAFADFQNDVTADDLALAHQEGFKAPEHAKRYTTLGMATDQGKTSNVVALGIIAKLSGISMSEAGPTTFRPPYTPVAMGALAGHHRGKEFKPVRLTPSHGWAKEQGAAFVEVGLWMRAQYYPKAGERDWFDAMKREVATVRTAVGVCDVSTLGKIEVQGADAAAFLDRVYANPIKSLAAGRIRYGLMLREDGFAMDDGIIARLGENHFFISTTTANAVKVMQHLEFCHQVHWPEFDVRMTSQTEHWAQFSIAGPRSLDVLTAVVDAGHDISDEALPHLSVRDVSVGGGIPARLYRMSYSGELAYEIGVPAGFGDALIRVIMQAGAPFGIAPYGTEALAAMRIEKGHVAGGELNGHTTARDLGLGKLVSRKKDYVGRVLAERPALVEADRPSLIGVKPVDRAERLRAGAHFIAAGKPADAANDEGYLTSVAYSPTLGHFIGLGFLAGGAARIGETIRACDPVRGGDVTVEVCHPVFVDPDGTRMSPPPVGEAGAHSAPGEGVASRPRAPLNYGGAWDGLARPGRIGRREGDGIRVTAFQKFGAALLFPAEDKGAEVAQAMETAFGVSLPGMRKRVASDRLELVWAGPGKWLALSPDMNIARELSAKLAGIAAISDQSGARGLLEISGAGARDFFAKGLAVDLHETRFKTGDVAMSSISYIAAHIWQTAETPAYRLTVARSMAGSFWSWLVDAGAEFGLSIDVLDVQPA